MNARLTLIALVLGSIALHGQTKIEPSMLAKPPVDSWPTYNGDYSGRRFSTLTRIDAANVNTMSLAWVRRFNFAALGGGSIKATPLQINGVLYFTIPDHVWAVDARTGREIWHYEWPSSGGNRIGNRGVGVVGDWLFFETPDCHLVSLRLKDGQKRWQQKICEGDEFYYASVAPVIVKNHVMVGVSGDDLDRPGYLQAHDPETGAMQWRWYVVPQKMGDPGSETWPNEAVMKHGGGMTWTPVTYDPELNLVFVTTGNPQPVLAYKNRKGDNLFTGSIVALNPDTGKMVWYFQSSPHDTHDWDSTQTAVLIDGEVDGKPRKLVAQAARNGYYFLLDRATGKAIVSKEYVRPNWASGFDERGQPKPNPAKMPQVPGALVTPDQAGASNWQPPAFSPLTGLFYVSSARAWSIYYLYDPSDEPQGWGGMDRGGHSEPMIRALDYKTGAVKWTHRWEGNARSGLLVTAGNVLFAGGNSGDIVALNATTGEAIWHAGLGNQVTNGPITYMLDGMQYVVVGAGDSLFAFVK